jgi:hypothetical protein
MPKRTLAERVAALERQVAELRATLASRTPAKDWRRTIGMFAGDEVMKEITEEALKYREKDQERARRHFARQPRRKNEG